MPHKKRKVRKRRGSRTHGYGRVGQHRGGGQRGGKGRAGLHKGKWTHTIKHDPEYFGKHGFSPPKRKESRTINVGELDGRIEELLENKQAEKTEEGIRLDLNRLGYDKLLGRGEITHSIIVLVDSCSESAAEKIEEVGGKILEAERQNS
jgi:large subunit ribosomal protein L15